MKTNSLKKIYAHRPTKKKSYIKIYTTTMDERRPENVRGAPEFMAGRVVRRRERCPDWEVRGGV